MQAASGSRIASYADDTATLYQSLWKFRSQMHDVRDPGAVLRGALRLGLELFDASNGCLAVIGSGRDVAGISLSLPQTADWDSALLGGVLRGYPISVPRELMFCRLRRRGRMWGSLVLRSRAGGFSWSERKAFSLFGDVVNELMSRIDADRVRDVRAQVDRKLLEQARPSHLFYKLLHGIRSLTEYDHSAALLLFDPGDNSLEIVAEQITVQKVKSQNVGLKLPVTPELQQVLLKYPALGFDRRDGLWTEWTSTCDLELAELLDYNPQAHSDCSPLAENSIVCAPLHTRNGLLGVLKVATVHPGSLGQYETDLLSQFLPQAAVALQNLRKTEQLEQQVLIAERKNAMADLARGVAHDVNNALGATLPLVQQLLDDLNEGCLSVETAREDLQAMERSLQLCRRVFGGMLSFARNSRRNRSEVRLHQAVDGALAVYRRGLQVQGIDLQVDVPPGLPPLSAVHADLEQLVLNLVGNSRDAMASGGTLSIRASRVPRGVELTVSDTGCGIASEDLRRIQEPFFTTRSSGTGLGLAICRAIVVQMQGQLAIESRLGHGTTVRVLLPYPEGT
ncbi:MAG: hypothetical protein KDA79_07210 [Planctomycetaceae bacterium]|nr:hypothetical protein [Planctomycetaceae bacterium]